MRKHNQSCDSQCHCGRKPQPNLVFFPLLFVQRISLYHIGIAQLLAYYRTADLGDVTPPTYIRLPVSSVWIYNATWKRWWWQNFTLHSSRRLKSGSLLRCLDSCFCLTFFDVVLVTSPHPPHPRMCLYYACVCIYMCVYIHTVYVYIYICSICNLWWKVSKIPQKVDMSLPYYTLSSLGISNDPPTWWENLRDTKSCTSSTQLPVSWLKTQNQICSCLWHEKDKTSTKQLYLCFLSFLFYPSWCQVEMTKLGPFKFLENVSIRLVLHKSSGSSILWNRNKENCILWHILDPKRTRQTQHAIWPDENKHKTYKDCSYYNN